MRADLLALTADDLAAVVNRGAVKRAQRDLEGSASVIVDVRPDDTVTVTCNDGTAVVLAPGATIEDAACTCDAVGPCRHMVRAVLAYQAVAGSDEEAHAWDPGAFTDDEISAALKAAPLRRGRALVAAGVTATLVRSAKPIALLHDADLTVRFLVPGELAYARCDCMTAPPCEHVVAAVAAFRALSLEQESGVVTLSAADQSPDARVVPASLPDALATLAEAGVASGRKAAGDELRRAETQCRAAHLAWPADVLAELADLCDRQARGDGSFEPLRVAQLAGEAMLRAAALASPHSTVPPLFSGGPPSSAETVVGSGRLIGIGTRVRDVGGLVDIDALVYDTAGHRVLSVGRTFGDPDDVALRAFAELAATSVQRGISFAGVGSGQLVVTGAARSPAGRLRLGRRPAALSRQRFEWGDLLRSPLLVEGESEARAIARAAVPPPLGPRTAGAGMVVVELAAISAAGFHAASGTVLARAEAVHGGMLTIAHPFTSRGASGSERLLSRLVAARNGEVRVRHVAGEVRIRGAETVIAPTAVVVESGGDREAVQPWVDVGDPGSTDTIQTGTDETPPGDLRVAGLVNDIQEEIGRLLVAGVARADRTLRSAWSELAALLESAGSVVLAEGVRAVAAALEARAHDTGWTPTPAVDALLTLARNVELARAL